MLLWLRRRSLLLVLLILWLLFLLLVVGRVETYRPAERYRAYPVTLTR